MAAGAGEGAAYIDCLLPSALWSPILGMMIDFLLKHRCGCIWRLDLKAPVSSGASDMALAEYQGRAPPHHCRVGAEVLVRHLASVGTHGRSPHQYWAKVGLQHP